MSVPLLRAPVHPNTQKGGPILLHWVTSDFTRSIWAQHGPGKCTFGVPWECRADVALWADLVSARPFGWVLLVQGDANARLA